MGTFIWLGGFRPVRPMHVENDVDFQGAADRPEAAGGDRGREKGMWLARIPSELKAY